MLRQHGLPCGQALLRPAGRGRPARARVATGRPRMLHTPPRSSPGRAADSAADGAAHLLLPAQEGSAERYLADVCGVPESQVEAVMSAAVAWRVTAGGRPLIDRRRRSRVERNIRIVERYLIDKCGVPAGARPVLTSLLQMLWNLCIVQGAVAIGATGAGIYQVCERPWCKDPKCKVGKSPAKTGGTPLHIWGCRLWACSSRMSQRGW